MKLLSISAKGLPLFKEELYLTFYAGQRVSEADRNQLHLLRNDSSFYLNNVEALIGINASGKTSVLKIILLALNLLNNEPINHMETRDILGQAEKVTLNLCFYSDCDEICRLETVIVSSQDQSREIRYTIKEETLWTKPASSVVTKKALLDFEGIAPTSTRSNSESFLPSDTSIIIAYNKQHQQHIQVCDLLSLTNINVLPVSDDVPLWPSGRPVAEADGVHWRGRRREVVHMEVPFRPGPLRERDARARDRGVERPARGHAVRGDGAGKPGACAGDCR